MKAKRELCDQILNCLQYWLVVARQENDTQGKIFARQIDFGTPNNPAPGLVLYPCEEAMDGDAAVTYDEFEDTLYMSLTPDYEIIPGHSSCPLECAIQALQGVSPRVDKIFHELNDFLPKLKDLARDICAHIQTTH